MPFVQSIVGQSSSQISNNITGVTNSVQNQIGVETNNIKNTLSNSVSNLTTPQGIAAALAQIGGSSSSLSLTGPGNIPGYSSTVSSSGGITPGDALLGAQSRPDPLLSFLWYCQLPVIGSAAGTGGAAPGVSNLSNSLTSALTGIVGALGSSMGGILPLSNAAQLPWYYIEEATCPFRQFQTISIFRDGRERHYPSKYTMGNLRLGLYADVQSTSLTYLQNWNNTILQPFDASNLSLAGGYGTPQKYKYPIYIYLLDPMKNELAILEYVECWPTNIADYGLTSNTSERIINHVDFSVGDMFVSTISLSAELTSLFTSATGTTLPSVQNAIGSAISSIF